MNHKPIFILVLLLVALSAALTPTPAQAATFTVTRTDDPPPDGCQPGDCSLREAVIAANISAGPDTITLLADTYTLSITGHDNAAVVGDLDITGNVTITGAGIEGPNTTMIDGDFSIYGVFDIKPNVYVEMSNLIITRGYNTGGGIYNAGTLSLKDIIIKNNKAPADNSGGGIYNLGILTLNRVVISDNVAKLGGGIRNVGSLTITDSTFRNNSDPRALDFTDPKGIGGAIHNSGTLSVTRTIFDMNQADSGGAIFNSSIGSPTVATFTDVTFTGNSARGSGITGLLPGGGAIFNRESMSLIRSTVNGNSSGVDGGSILNDTGTLTIIDSSIHNNTAATTGGGILNDTGTLTITASSIYSNSASSSGGGIHNRNKEFAKGVVSLSHSTLSGNSAGQSGGGLFNDLFGATANLSQVTVANNTADSDNNGSGDGGGIFYVPVPPYVRSGIVRLAGTLLAGNVDRGGEAPDCGGGQLNSQGYNLVQHVTGCTLGGDTSGNLTGVDPLLGSLADNGGPTLTHLPAAGSPAIDAGDPANCPATDQRGFPRPVDGDGKGAAVCDIGAVEFGAMSRLVYLPLVVK